MMSPTRLFSAIVGFGPVAFGSLVAAYAQQAAPAESAASPRAAYSYDQHPAARPALKFGADYQLAAWLAAEAHGELQIAQLALERGSDDDIRGLAKSAVERETAIIQALQPFLGEEAVESPAAQKPQPSATATAAVERPAGAAVAPPLVSTVKGPAFTLVSLKRSLADQATTSLLDELRNLSGADFDRRYRDHRVLAERRHADTLLVLREHASPALRAVIDSWASQAPAATPQAARASANR